MSPSDRIPAPVARPARAVQRRGPEAEDDRLAKLPVWAQDEVQRLRRALAEAREERDAFLNGIPSSNTCYGRTEGITGNGPRWVYLPDNATVRFYLDGGVGAGKPDRERPHVEVNVSHSPQRRPHIRIATDRQVAVFPIAANCFNALEVDDAP